MRPISAIELSVVLGLVCGGITGCVDTAVSDSGCQVGLQGCDEGQCCSLRTDEFDGFCTVLDPAVPPSLSGYCESACHVTDDCVDGAVCLHPSPCDGDPGTKGVCTPIGEANPELVECPDERP